jgi:zinc transporter 1/2/3
MGHARHHEDSADVFAAQMTAIFILEFGVIFHSIFIGLTLAVAGEEFTILYIVLVFHQTFEGLGLGSRLATARWPGKKWWLPWALGTTYGLTTPVAIAVGLGVRETFSPGSVTTLIVNGVFDSISAGILIYTGLVELMAHEFMFNQEMRKSSIGMMLSAFGCMALGAGLMALLGKWA